MKTEILLDYEKSRVGTAYVVRALLRITGEGPAGGGRVPLNIGIVLDRSGSMTGEPLEQAKEAAALLVRRLAPEDVVSVVAYDHEVWTVAEPATGEAQQELVNRIREIVSGGTTNLSGGWLCGRELVARARRDGVSNRLLLLTDGLANVGITDPDQLAGLCRQAAEQGIYTTTIGFGPDYDEVLLRRMAEAGGGNMYYIESPEQAPGVFATEIEGLLSLCAQNLAVEIRPASGAELTIVHHRYPRQQLEDGVRLELGDLYPREPRHLLAEFLVEAMDPTAEVEIATLTVTAHVVAEKGRIERQEIRLPIRASLAGGPRVDPDVRRELLLQEAARAREEAYRAHREGDDDHASTVLLEAAEVLAAYAAGDPALLEEAQDLTEFADRFAAYEVNEADAKYLYQRGYAISTSRPSTLDAISRSGRRGRPKPAAGSSDPEVRER